MSHRRASSYPPKILTSNRMVLIRHFLKAVKIERSSVGFGPTHLVLLIFTSSRACLDRADAFWSVDNRYNGFVCPNYRRISCSCIQWITRELKFPKDSREIQWIRLLEGLPSVEGNKQIQHFQFEDSGLLMSYRQESVKYDLPFPIPKRISPSPLVPAIKTPPVWPGNLTRGPSLPSLAPLFFLLLLISLISSSSPSRHNS